MTQNSEDIISTSFSLPVELKERLENLAKSQDLKTSQLLRRILRDYFEKIDTETPAPVAA